VLKAAKALAEYLQAGSNAAKKEVCLGFSLLASVLSRFLFFLFFLRRVQTALTTLKALQQTSTDPYIEVLTATALFHEENYPEALRVLRFLGNLEWYFACLDISNLNLLTRAHAQTATHSTSRLCCA